MTERIAVRACIRVRCTYIIVPSRRRCRLRRGLVMVIVVVVVTLNLLQRRDGTQPPLARVTRATRAFDEAHEAIVFTPVTFQRGFSRFRASTQQ